MARVIVTSLADSDTATILDYLAKVAGARTAIKYDRLFDRLYDRLADHPASGPRRPALGADTRIGIVSPYIVIYDYSEPDNTVTILRIVHGRRDITGKLLSGRKS
jgi:plasmid stabilization system protein ParE